MYHRWWLDDVWFLRYGTQQTDGWADGSKRWNIEVGVPPKKSEFQTECNSLWDEKKRTVNQILLSKLWYISQIDTFPKFIKGEIEKISQLSICKCGLGILYIDTQLNYLELQRIQRLLDPTNPLWKGLMLH